MPSAAPAKSDGPVVKRQKLAVGSAKKDVARKSNKSKIFAPFRTIGLVSPSEVPFTTVPLGKTTFQITTSIGRSLQTYDLRRGLNLIFITRPQTPCNITATTAWRDKVLAAWGGEETISPRGVWAFKRGKKVAELELPAGSDENIRQLLVFGSWIVGCCSTKIEVWKSTTLEHYTTLQSPFASSTSNMLSGGVVNMPTYLNKIFVGRRDGTVEIWNVSTGKLLYTILPASSDYGAVTALEPTPALSLLAIAYENGPVVIQDVRADKQVIKINTGASMKAPTTSISFRTDGMGAGDDGRKDGVMATSCKQSGDVTFWDLNKGGRKMGVLRGAHNPPSATESGVTGGVSKIEFLAGQAVLLTSGLDNSLKTWIFDEQPFSPIPRILHSRSGHSAPVTRLQFLPSDADGADAGGKWLLSASRDRSLWGWSLRRDGQSTELSQGHIRKKAKKMGVLSGGLASLDSIISLEDLKAPKITCIACSLNRDGGMGAAPGTSTIWSSSSKDKKGKVAETNMTGWESVVTGHEGDKFARTWFWGRKKAGRWALETGDGSEVKSVAVSPCGTFALVGSVNGSIDMYNLQSGMRRQRFPAPITQTQAKRLQVQQVETAVELHQPGPKKFAKGQGKHTKAVTGIVVDNLNRTVISCGADGKVKFWDFASGILVHEIDWYPMTAITGIRYHSGSDLIALSCDDGSIRVVDITTKKLVRELFGSTEQIVDFLFSNDGRWIVAAAGCVVRVWDLPTGHLIDAMRFSSPCTALAFSHTGEYLATAQEGGVGVNIWTNKTLFTHVPTRHISEDDIAEVDAPTASGEGSEGVLTGAFAEDDDAVEEEDASADLALPNVDELADSLTTTLSLVPKSRWQTLLHLDIIRARNKPKEAPKAPEKAPFFLPSMASDLPTGIAGAPAQQSKDNSQDTSRVLSTLATGPRDTTSTTSFTALLANYAGAPASDRDPGPIVAHLSPLPPSAADLTLRSLLPAELAPFIDALTQRLSQKRDYELVQAWIAVLLRLHGEVIVHRPEALAALGRFRQALGTEAGRLGELVGFASGVIGWVRGPR